MTGRELHWEIDGQDVAVRIEESTAGGIFRFGEQNIPFTYISRHRHGGWVSVDGKPHEFYVLQDRGSHTVWLDGRTYRLERANKGRPSEAAELARGDCRITALMPGRILRIEVAVGDTVAEKQILATMESMKMETSLLAPMAGRVAAIHCRPGQIVEMGELLIVIEE